MAAVAVALIALAALVVGSGTDGPRGAADGPTVFAAASLRGALPEVDPGARFSFAGSDTLAQQIRAGAPADVFASAAPALTRALHHDGLVERPRALARNRLVLITPRADPAGIDAIGDLARPGVRLVIAGAGVPVGAYTRTALRRLGLRAALSNVVSEEGDVTAVLGKVALGEADAGVVYATDARAAASRLRTVAIPASAQPAIRYEIAVVAGARDPAAARAFIRRVTGPRGRATLARAGFLPPEDR